MRIKEITNINEVTIDPIKGIGNVPNNQEIDYYGVTVMMKPSVFLKLAKSFDSLSGNKEKIEKMAQYIKDGGAIAPPFLNINFQEKPATRKDPNPYPPYDFTKPAVVGGHEGRHRMSAIMSAEGDNPVEVQLFFYQIKRRGLNKQLIDSINKKIWSQNDVLLKGPFFTLVSQLNESFPTQVDSDSWKDGITNFVLTRKQSLNESFDQPYDLDWDWNYKGGISPLDKACYATFRTKDALQGEFYAGQDNSGLRIVVDGYECPWEISFSVDGDVDVTGKGDQQRILATIITAMEKFIKTVQPNSIKFTSDKSKSDSRTKLYTKMCQKYAEKLGYKLVNIFGFKQDDVFRLSKINETINESVNDRIWFHGTTKSFDNFSNTFTTGQLGIHLGTLEQAKWRLGDDQGYILSVKANVTNLLRLKDDGSWYGEHFVKQLQSNPKTNSIKWRGSMSDREIRHNLIQLGYDGIIYNNKFEGETHSASIIVFDPNKLKIIKREPISERIQDYRKVLKNKWELPSDLEKFLINNKYEFLGQGEFAAVYGKPNDNIVIKVGKNYTHEDGYLSFSNFVRKNNNIHFPKCGKCRGMVNDKGDFFYVIPIEKLYHLPKEEIKKYLEMINLWKTAFSYEIFCPDEMLKQKNNWLPIAGQFAKDNYSLYQAVELLAKEYENLDIHDQNIMKRKNGTIVLSDPIGVLSPFEDDPW